MATTDIITPWRERGPLFVIAGAHGSLHWAMAVFYLLLPFIKTEYGLPEHSKIHCPRRQLARGHQFS